MRIAYHIGAHCTDDNLLVASLLKNRDALAERSVFVPANHIYRAVIRDVLLQLRGQPANEETQDFVLSEIMGDREADRLVLSFDHFLCGPAKVLGEGMLYPTAAERSAWLTNIFPDDPCEIFFAIRDPATFLPALYQKVADKMSVGEFLQGIDPLALRWTEVVERIRDANPECPLTVWCNEDTPLIWPAVLREVADVDQLVPMEGGYDVIQTIMSSEGFKRMQTYIETHPPQTEVQHRRVMAAFLDKFALEDELDVEIDLPGWTDEMVEELSARYEEDVYDIERMSGVTLIST
ncbi:MAG: hypothetical protein ACE368_12835 [Paracoccaceae bacterium]